MSDWPCRHCDADGITGALTFNERFFAQVLEGRHDKLQHAFERIQRDDRHDRVTVLCFEPIGRRHVERWSMACVATRSTAWQRFDTATRTAGFDLASSSGRDVHEILEEHLVESGACAI